jgi:hypothetical protein
MTIKKLDGDKVAVCPATMQALMPLETNEAAAFSYAEIARMLANGQASNANETVCKYPHCQRGTSATTACACALATQGKIANDAVLGADEREELIGQLHAIKRDVMTAGDLLHDRWKAQSRPVARRLVTYWPALDKAIAALASQPSAQPSAEAILGQCCYGGMKRKKDCASCAAWPVNGNTQATPPTVDQSQTSAGDEKDKRIANLEQMLSNLEKFTGAYIPRGQTCARSDYQELFDALKKDLPTVDQSPDAHRAIHLALHRIECVQSRDGGLAWHDAKDILKSDLDLIADGLRQSLRQTVDQMQGQS